MLLDVKVESTLKMIKDDQLGSYLFLFYLMTTSDNLAAKDIFWWLSAPDSSKNYNEAREKHQKDTCSWFLKGPWFQDLQENGGFLWIKGTGKSSDESYLWSILNKNTAGSGKTILWWVPSGMTW